MLVFSSFRGDAVTITRGIEYGRAGSTPLLLDLYVPDGPGPFPVIVWIHGGGWSGGTRSLDANGPIVRQTTRGYALASLDYRLSGQARFPAQIEDVKAGLRWLRKEAATHRLDASRLAVWGSSAGGHLVALLGTSGGVADLAGTLNPGQNDRVTCVVDWFGPSNFVTMAGQSLPCSTIDHSAASSPEGQLLGCAPPSCPETARRASPVTYVSPDDPPFLIVHGTNDCTVPPGQSQELHDALRAAGVDSTLVLIPGAGHGGAPFTDATRLPQLEAFLDAHLRAPASAPPRLLVPSAARIAGAGGAFYTTSLTVSNPGPSDAAFTLRFLGNAVDGTAGPERSLTLGAGKSATYPDVLASVFGLDSGFGALAIESETPLVAQAETSTPGASGGTFGQSVPALPSADWIAAGTPRSIPGVGEDGAFRTNLVLANAVTVPVDVDVALVSEAGSTLGTKRYALPPLGMIQVSRVVRDLGFTAPLSTGRLVVSVVTSGGAVAAYAARIDEITNDPRMLLPR
ncbi:MAG: alpha/beta hydrolase [Acidobacteria bacterium]|nr:alpha/beta hydrolase [Acidobacteriota bacterium]